MTTIDVHNLSGPLCSLLGLVEPTGRRGWENRKFNFGWDRNQIHEGFVQRIFTCLHSVIVISPTCFRNLYEIFFSENVAMPMHTPDFEVYFQHLSPTFGLKVPWHSSPTALSQTWRWLWPRCSSWSLESVAFQETILWGDKELAIGITSLLENIGS